MNNFGYQQYKRQSINTMTQGELLLLLYDEAIKRLLKSEMALKNNDIEVFENSIERVSAIIRYLDETLDKSYAISKDISKLYAFFLFEMARIKAGRNVAVINEVKDMIMDLRNTFKEADRISQVQSVKG